MYKEEDSFLNYPFLEIRSQLENFKQTMFNTNNNNISLLINNGGRLAQNLIEYVYRNKKEVNEDLYRYSFKEFLDKKCGFIPKHLCDSAEYFQEKRYEAFNSVEYEEEIEDVFFTYLESYAVFLYLFGNYLSKEFNDDERFVSLYDTTELIQNFINVERARKHLTNSNGFNLNNNVTSSDIYKMLNILDSKMDALSKKVDERSDEILDEIGKLDEKLEEFNNNLVTLRKQTLKKLKNAEGNEDKQEKIYNKFNHKCAVEIRDSVEKCTDQDEYDAEEKKIIDKIGENAWGKLDESSQRFLTTSKITYNYLCKHGNTIDYSGVCLPATKALEVELRKRFIDGFLDYLDSEYEENYPVYHTVFYTEYNKEYYRIREGDKTLGKIPHILGSTPKSQKMDKKKGGNNTSKLVEYSTNTLFIKEKHDTKEIKEILKGYGSKVNSLTDKYRNDAAHIGLIDRTRAKNCLDEIINNEDNFLKTMLDSFDKEKPKHSS